MSSSRLLPCPACERHVRAGDATCPFCAAALPDRANAPAPRLAGRLSRAALFALGASAAACGKATVVPGEDAAAPVPAETPDASFDNMPRTIYGGPPLAPDAGFVPAPPYGMPPPIPPEPFQIPDAGKKKK